MGRRGASYSPCSWEFLKKTLEKGWRGWPKLPGLSRATARRRRSDRPKPLVSFREKVIVEADKVGVPSLHAKLKTAYRILCTAAKLDLTRQQFGNLLDMFSLQGQVRSEVFDVGLRE